VIYPAPDEDIGKVLDGLNKHVGDRLNKTKYQIDSSTQELQRYSSLAVLRVLSSIALSN
jgi:hypothetical protein